VKGKLLFKGKVKVMTKEDKKKPVASQCISGKGEKECSTICKVATSQGPRFREKFMGEPYREERSVHEQQGWLEIRGWECGDSFG